MIIDQKQCNKDDRFQNNVTTVCVSENTSNGCSNGLNTAYKCVIYVELSM